MPSHSQVTPLLGAAILASLLLVSCQPTAATVTHNARNDQKAQAAGSTHCGPGTPDRPITPVKLSSGDTFCLRMPRYLKSPGSDFAGGSTFPRTWNDTCGLYAVTFHAFIPAGGGPDPHLHLSDEEYFMPVTPGNVLRVYAEAGPKQPRKYQAGEVPGYNLPPVAPMGHLDVPAGSIAYSPPNTPHTWKGVTNLTNYVIFWVNGFVMEPSINIPQMSKNATLVMWESALWSSPTDITAGMFGGRDYLSRSLERTSNLPAVTLAQMQRLQARFDEGEACFPRDGMRPVGAKPQAASQKAGMRGLRR